MAPVVAKIGTVEIRRVLDSYLLGQTMQTWFPDFDREAVKPHEHWLCPTHYNPDTGHFPMPVHSWVFEINGCKVLIDTCLGNDKERPGQLEMDHLGTGYLRRLHEQGINPDEIDFVMCTHLHVDHVGWNTRLVDGRWVPTFPNARYVMSRLEYQAASVEAQADATPQFIRNVFADSIHPLVEHGQAVFVEGIMEFLPGLTLVPSPGHSPDHLRISLRSQGQIGVFAGDMLHSPVQVPFWEWSSRVCWNKSMAAQARRRLLEFCAEHGALLLPGHFETPHFGRVAADGDRFQLNFDS